MDNITNDNNNIINEENTKINSFQSSKLIPHNHRYGSLINNSNNNNNNTQNKNGINLLSLSQKPKNGKILQIFDKPSNYIKKMEKI